MNMVKICIEHLGVVGLQMFDTYLDVFHRLHRAETVTWTSMEF